MSTRDVDLFFCGAMIMIPVVLIIVADIRSRSGYGLMWLALALIGLTVLSAIYYRPGPANLAGLYILGVILEIGWACTLVLWIGALVESGMARAWGWFVGLVLTVPMLALLAFFAPGIPPSTITALASILLPALVILAYGIFRIAAARNAAPPRWS